MQHSSVLQASGGKEAILALTFNLLFFKTHFVSGLQVSIGERCMDTGKQLQRCTLQRLFMFLPFFSVRTKVSPTYSPKVCLEIFCINCAKVQQNKFAWHEQETGSRNS